MEWNIVIKLNITSKQAVSKNNGFVKYKSIFSSIVLLVLNKYIYLNILLYFTKPLFLDTACLLVILSLITIFHSISLNLKGFSLRKFNVTSSMITFGVLLIYLIYSYLSLLYLLF
jgi:hypothetical protein